MSDSALRVEFWGGLLVDVVVIERIVMVCERKVNFGKGRTATRSPQIRAMTNIIRLSWHSCAD